MIKSQSIRYKDFSSEWYRKWSKLLRQEKGLYGRAVHNKAWQNAIILQALSERGYLKEGVRAIGFGVGTERLPSALAALGVHVMATDQDRKHGEKEGWDNIGQLTHSLDDLNQYGIAPKDLFGKNVEFQNCDMNNINKRFRGAYDIVWSNCALGHLGSIDAGLNFIEKSLDCLKSGGIAVHTTEVNITSNNSTLDAGGTVIFRRRDLLQLFFTLRSKGFQCTPLVLNFGSQPQDMQFGFHPYEDEPLLKISVGGYLLSQVVLIIHKPQELHERSAAAALKAFEEGSNYLRARSYLYRNPGLRQYMKPERLLKKADVQPISTYRRINLAAKETKSLRLRFKNTGLCSYYDIYHAYRTRHPLVIATFDPLNRDSTIRTEDWLSPNRPNMQISLTHRASTWGEVKPGSEFWVTFSVKAPKKPGKYIEKFCFAIEGFPEIAGSEFTIELNVT